MATSNDTSRPIAAEIRRKCSMAFACDASQDFGGKELFSKSKQWAGFNQAFNSWNRALWAWVDRETPTAFAKRVRSALGQVDWSRLRPQAFPEARRHDNELACQWYSLRRTVFLTGLRYSKAQDPSWYEGFAFEIHIARHLKDTIFFEKLAEMKQRKRSKDKADRQLKYALLFGWMGGCLWAFTTDGMAALLNSTFPRSSGKLYIPKTISDTRRDLKLWRLPKPLYWGLSGKPPRLQSLH